MSEQLPFTPNEALEKILLRYELSPENFHKLRPDSYEQCIAAHSLEQLELFYALLLEPKLTLEERAAKAPYWPPGTKLSGDSPSTHVIKETRRRMMKERSLNDVSQVTEYIDALREKLGGQSAGNQRMVLDSVLDAIGEELVVAKMEGESVSDKIDAAQLLLFAQASKDKAEQENAKIALKKHEASRKDEELKLNLKKFQRETCEMFIKWYGDAKARSIVENTSVGKQQQLELLGKQMYGDLW